MLKGPELIQKLFKVFSRFTPFNRYARLKPPPFPPPQIAGEDEGRGLNDLNSLNCLNGHRTRHEKVNKVYGTYRSVSRAVL